MTVLGPLPETADRLDVVSKWRIDDLIDVVGREKEVVEAALAKLDYNRDLRAQLFVPPELTVPATFTGHRTYVCVNQKGGAGKTTTAVELAAAWVAMGYTVRVIDADPQEASLSGEWLLPRFDGIAENERHTLNDVLFGRQPLDETTYETSVQGLYIVPSGDDLGTVEYDPRAARDGSLRTAIRKSKAPVDITIIDAPPALWGSCPSTASSPPTRSSCRSRSGRWTARRSRTCTRRSTGSRRTRPRSWWWRPR
ncbi:AAA family ATPase [Streptomyces fungicidicus]|uniref:AAA family ATPase n=1 Tax=Streptomyces fungicidicus TaxID=68203 RepID=UPI00382FD02F